MSPMPPKWKCDNCSAEIRVNEPRYAFQLRARATACGAPTLVLDDVCGHCAGKVNGALGRMPIVARNVAV